MQEHLHSIQTGVQYMHFKATATENFACSHAVHSTEDAACELWLAKAIAIYETIWATSPVVSHMPRSAHDSWGRYRILETGVWDTDCQRWSPVGGSRDILPQKILKIEALRNGICDILRPSQLACYNVSYIFLNLVEPPRSPPGIFKKTSLSLQHMTTSVR